MIYYYNPETTGVPTWKLYNLQEDPYEALDVADQYPDVTSSMIKSMHKQLEKENALYPVDKDGHIIR